jgi:hypothetical protein
MCSRIKYEFSRIFFLKTLPIFLLFFIASLFLVNTGIAEYKRFLKDLAIDIDIEYQNQKLFASYERKLGKLGDRQIPGIRANMIPA